VRFSRFFTDRPIFAVVLSLVILAGGLLAIGALPISEYPEVTPPTITVRAVYPGANPTVLAQTVGTPLEDAIHGVEQMPYVNSAATADGSLSLTVTFAIGTDVDLAQVQVQNRVNQALARLPEEVRALGVVTEKRSPDITMVVHLVSPDGRYDPVYLRNYALLNVRNELARLPGAGQVIVFGAGDYAMRVWLDPNKVASRGLSANDVVQAIREQNLQVAAGVVVLFLQTWRASVIPLAAVPISIVGTFAVMLASGFSINTLSLFGMVLAIGIVVDDAIVVVENVERHIEEGLTPLEASHRAMDEVSGPIVAIALVLCAVFVPVAFINGLTGQFYRQFALTIAFSTLISAFNSLTLSPALAAVLLRPHDAPADRPTRVINRLFGWAFRPFNRA